MFYVKFKKETLTQAVAAHGSKDSGFRTLLRAIEAAESIKNRCNHYDIIKIDGTVVFEKRTPWWKTLIRRILLKL